MNQHKKTVLLLAAGFGVLLSLLAAITLIGLERVSQTVDQLERVVEQHNVQAELATQMRVAARERLITLWRMSLTEDPFERDERLEQFFGVGTRFLVARDDFMATDLDASEQTLIGQLMGATATAAPIHREVANQLARDGNLVSRWDLLHEALPAQEATLATLDKIIDLQKQQSQRAYSKATGDLRYTSLLMLALTAAALVFGLVLAAYLQGHSSRLLRQNANARDALARANRDLEARVRLRTQELSDANAQLNLLANYDSLTGLANRHLFMGQIDVLLRQARRARKRLAVLFIDLDGFKAINDRFGHQTGDRALVAVAELLRANIRDADLAARLGGDEFIVVLPELGEPQQARTVAEKILSAIERTKTIRDTELPLGASVGIACYPEDGATVDELINAADASMYRNKPQRDTRRLRPTQGHAT